MTNTQYWSFRKAHPELDLPPWTKLALGYHRIVRNNTEATVLRKRTEYLLSRPDMKDKWRMPTVERAKFTQFITSQTPAFDSRILADVKPVDGWL